jgi:hypothetical protein
MPVARCQILKATSMKMAVFWDAVSRGLVGADLRFRSAYCLYLHGNDRAACAHVS